MLAGKRLEDVNDIFWTSYMRWICVLCPWDWEVGRIFLNHPLFSGINQWVILSGCGYICIIPDNMRRRFSLITHRNKRNWMDPSVSSTKQVFLFGIVLQFYILRATSHLVQVCFSWVFPSIENKKNFVQLGLLPDLTLLC